MAASKSEAATEPGTVSVPSEGVGGILNFFPPRIPLAAGKEGVREDTEPPKSESVDANNPGEEVVRVAPVREGKSCGGSSEPKSNSIAGREERGLDGESGLLGEPENEGA